MIRLSLLALVLAALFCRGVQAQEKMHCDGKHYVWGYIGDRFTSVSNTCGDVGVELARVLIERYGHYYDAGAHVGNHYFAGTSCTSGDSESAFSGGTVAMVGVSWFYSSPGTLVSSHFDVTVDGPFCGADSIDQRASSGALGTAPTKDLLVLMLAALGVLTVAMGFMAGQQR